MITFSIFQPFRHLDSTKYRYKITQSQKQMGMNVHMLTFTVAPPGESIPVTHRVRNWVGPRAGPDNLPLPEKLMKFHVSFAS
jgi:hypothetical protein